MYTFDDMLKDLDDGREIEFTLGDKSYGIVNFDGYWLFCCEIDHTSIQLAEFEDREALKRKIADKQLIGLDVKEIIDKKTV